MKSLSATPAANAIRAFCTASLLGFLAACSTAGLVPRHETDAQTLEQLRTGRAVLDCDQQCGDAWRNARPQMMTYYKANDWRDLALFVIQTDYRQDLAYFYLGRAAEGLDETKAAQVYYKTAEALATGTVDSAKCAATPEGCDGLTLLTEVLTHIQIVDARRSRDFPAARRQRNGQPASAEAPGAPGQSSTGNWVDPPPVTP